jgi:uncharacterized repeat protein (TIGR04076 family)
MHSEQELTLYDLAVEVRRRDGRDFVCGHKEGPAFRVVGEDIVFDQPGAFSLYALAALLPLLPAKQRALDDVDWIASDTDVACPDAACGAVFRIRRTARRGFPPEPPNTRSATS